jgi:ABC-2 type transport system ATP-binding protein
MEQVEEICNHIVLVNKGKKILDGTVKDVKQQFKEHLFSIGSDELPDNLPNAPYEKIGTKNHLQIVRIGAGKTPNDVLRYLLNEQVAIHSFNEILPSLNDIFIKLVEDTPASRQFQKL